MLSLQRVLLKSSVFWQLKGLGAGISRGARKTSVAVDQLLRIRVGWVACRFKVPVLGVSWIKIDSFVAPHFGMVWPS